MRITGIALNHEYKRAVKEWPFILSYEEEYHLPYMILFAVGSRETNLTNEVGDDGHGHGVWQLDNRSHIIPDGFDHDVEAQCKQAALMLHNLLVEFHDVERNALAAYNAGAGTVQFNLAHGYDVDTGTADGDYSLDVHERRMWLVEKYPATISHPAPKPTPKPRTYEVEEGDTLTSIAAHFHLTGGWEELYKANEHTIGSNPNLIHPGLKLTIPS